jgi:signal peptidase
MEPVIPTGSLIVIKEESQYAIGDVVTYGSLVRQNSTITHRIVDQRSQGLATYFVTKGDANNSIDDQPIPPSSVLGKHVFTIPLLGYPIGFASTPLGAVVLIIIPGTLILWEELKSLRAVFWAKK